MCLSNAASRFRVTTWPVAALRSWVNDPPTTTVFPVMVTAKTMPEVGVQAMVGLLREDGVGGLRGRREDDRADRQDQACHHDRRPGVRVGPDDLNATPVTGVPLIRVTRTRR